MTEIFVPGRLCILGEHTDWAGGYRTVNPMIAAGVTLVCATEEGLFARCRPIDFKELSIRSISDHGEERSVRVPLSHSALLEEAAKGGFFSYACGAALELVAFMEASGSISHGIEIDNYRTTLPMRKGLSSSAAVCVLVVRAFAAVWGLELSTQQVMELAFKGEMRTPSRCGRMDQCVAIGPGKIARMNFDGDKCSVQPIFCKTTLYFVVADLNRSKDTLEILRSLNSCFPVARNETEGLMHEYVAANGALALRAQVAVESGDVDDLGIAMKEAQELFDRTAGKVCPSELSSPRLHEVLADSDLCGCSVAAKGVGSQGDGSVQVLCSTEDHQRQALALLNGKLGCQGFKLTIPSC